MNHESELINALEPGQLTAFLEQPMSRCRLGRGAVALLIALRVYVIVAIPIVGYAFIQALGGHA
jgi:hypothetical protein